MKEAKRELIEKATQKFESLPVNEQNYVLGIMQGILIAAADKKVS